MDSPPLPLSLGFRPARGRSDYLVADCNAEAVAWIDRWPDWPATALALTGPAGAGKSHLAAVWAGKAGATACFADEVAERPPHAVLGMARSLLVEDVDRLPTDETALFHLFNLVKERRGHLLMTGRSVPARWPLRLADLRSRLATAVVAEIGAPDDPLLAGVLVKQFQDRHLNVSPPAIDYALIRIERSFAAAQRLAETLDDLVYSEKKARATIPLVRRALDIMKGN